MVLGSAHSVLSRSGSAEACPPRVLDQDVVSSPLAFTPALKRELEPLYERVKHVVTPMEWVHYAPIIKAINELKAERNAVILAHNYMTPEIFHCVGDFRGDSLQLAKEAARVDADVIVQAGVHFMAETSKLLSPDKTVLIPDPLAGCSLASSITPEDVRALRAAYPGVPIVTYVNTSAAVKAECDICCTSSNAVKIVESLGVPRVLLIPDQYLAKYVQTKTKVEIIAWKGACEVHERFTGEEMETMRAAEPGLKIIAHPECPPDVIAASDFTGSTAAMIDWVKTKRPTKVMLVTECSMASNVAAETPDVEFIRPCNLCPHMKRISLENIYEALLYNHYEVTVDPTVAAKARRAVERMVEAST
ncbi:quinolinate synthase NadA [Hyphomicrobium sp. CS1GBMeth3]|uniref:quinolinate synthase NadA n=1 Tax=Hyphomicrobium sp. CS1GBMeth3 TaxID=1892845 RepID=UPI0009303719|nr:quinolinate synthase NadA [Hyphomicrobium sp. CS1GBMeth3]